MNNMLKKIIESNDAQTTQMIEQFMVEIFENGARHFPRYRRRNSAGHLLLHGGGVRGTHYFVC